MTPHFPFVQFEFTHSIGPPAGRYVVHPDTPGEEQDAATEAREARAAAAAPVVDELAPQASATAVAAPPEGGGDGAAADAPEFIDPDAPLPLGSADVLVVKVLGAPPPKGKWFRRGLPPQVEGEPPREVSVTLVTAIFATDGMPDEEAAREWLSSVRSDPDGLEAWVTDGLAMVNRAVAAYRACAADPYVVELSRADPRAVRVGHGEAPQVVLGDWTAALGVSAPPPPRVTRTVQLMPTQGMASVLAGQGSVLEAEELILRSLLDLRHGRERAAAVGLQAGIELLLGELSGEILGGVVQQRVDALLPLRGKADELAAAARRGPLDEKDVAQVRKIAEAAGELIDQRRYAPMGF